MKHNYLFHKKLKPHEYVVEGSKYTIKEYITNCVFVQILIVTEDGKAIFCNPDRLRDP